MKGTLVAGKVSRADGKNARFVVRGNVGAENRAKLDALGMTPEVGIANSREIYLGSNEECIALRNALVAQGII